MNYRKLDLSERAKLLREYLQRIYGNVEGAVEDLQSTSDAASPGETLGAVFGGTEFAETLGMINDSRFDRIRSSRGIERTEAVIHSETGKRPAFEVVDGSYESPNGIWATLGDAAVKSGLEESIPSIGRIEVPDDWSRKYAGTGFVVGDGLLMTNRHVARLFSNGWGNRTIHFQRSQVDFLREVPRRGQPASTAFNVINVKLVHPYWDLAILEVRLTDEAEQGMPKSLSLCAGDPNPFFGTSVVVVGYPGFDSRGNVELQERIFKRYGYKRLQPGVLRGLADYRSNAERFVEFPVENALDHDCSTLGGNSGSAVLLTDPAAFVNQQAPVVGLHFAGDYLARNYAVPTHALAGDQRLLDAGLNFVGTRTGVSSFYPPLWRQADAENEILPVVSGPLEGPSGEEGSLSSLAEPSEHNDRFSRDSLLHTDFSWHAALACALASHLAYVQDETQVVQIVESEWGFDECKLVESDGIECFVAKSPTLYLVAFRGTERNIGDWLTDVNVLSRARPFGRVHAGFHSGFESVRALIEAELGDTSGGRLLLTGHSLGGALATIAAAEWHHTNSHAVSHVYTYGQPAVGKNGFIHFMDQELGDRFIRIVNDDDIVARVPPTYQHVGRLIQFRPNGIDETLQPTEATDSGEMLSMDQFDRLRLSLLERRVQQRAFHTEIAEEGFFPSFRDHSLDRYIERLVLEAP